MLIEQASTYLPCKGLGTGYLLEILFEEIESLEAKATSDVTQK
jgi:hypothetical protein